MSLIKIGEVCNFQGGTQPPKNEWKSEPMPGYVRMLQIRDFTQGKDKHIEFVKDSKKLNKCKADDILIGRYGASVGKILTGLEGAYNVAIIKTIPDETKIHKRYLYYFLLNPRFQNFIRNIGGRAAQQGFNKEDISDYKLFLPPLPDQLHIANLLSKAENLIAQRKESIRLLDEFLKSTFLEMFGHHFIEQTTYYQKIGEVCHFIDYRGKTLERVEQGVFYISAKCVRKGYFDFERIDYITEESYNKVMTRGFPKPNDVLFTTEGATMGFVCRIPRNFIKQFAVGQRLITLQPNETLKSEYLDFVLNHNEIQKQIFKRSSGSAAIGIRSAELSEIKIPIADISLQAKFGEIVEKTEALKTRYQKSLQELEHLYGSLSQRAFRGELHANKAVK